MQSQSVGGKEKRGCGGGEATKEEKVAGEDGCRRKKTIELGFDLFYDLDSENIEKDNGPFCLKNL